MSNRATTSCPCKLGTPELQADPAEYRKAGKTLSDLEPLVQKFREYKKVESEIAGAEELLRDRRRRRCASWRRKS